jgi:hypothetical protein
MNPQDGREMFELQLELHARATGRKPNISADEILELHEFLAAFTGDLKGLSGGLVADAQTAPAES